MTKYSAQIWGPYYWFVLHSIAMTYPLYPNATTKRKYYDFIQNLPLFLPDERIGNRFSELLNKYPVTPYLDKRDSFIRWMVFIHNKINVMLGKPQVSLEDALKEYHEKYLPDELKLYGGSGIQQNIVFIHAAIIMALLLVVYLLYF